MTSALRVALLGLSVSERTAIASGLRLIDRRALRYRLVSSLDDGDLVLADADDAPAVQLVLATERLADTVFVGNRLPPDAAAAVPRPIDPLQLVRALDDLRVRRSTVLEAEAPEPAATAPTALVVDDSETARCGLARRLQRSGILVEMVATSGQALALLSRRRFDGLFIDVDLGPASALDGFGLCQQLKRQPRPSHGAVPWVALVTGLDGPSDRIRGTLAGCDAYLTKPVDEAALSRLLWQEGWAPAPTVG